MSEGHENETVAARSTPLTDAESSAIDALVAEYSADDQIKAR